MEVMVVVVMAVQLGASQLNHVDRGGGRRDGLVSQLAGPQPVQLGHSLHVVQYLESVVLKIIEIFDNS